MKFQLVTYESLSPDEVQWLTPIDGKVEFNYMLDKVKSGEWWLFKLPFPSVGLAAGCEDDGKLFIYYLRGHQLFGTVSGEDLLDAARYVGLSGMKAETRKLGVLKLMLNKGFRLTQTLPGPIYGVELIDERR